MGSVFGVISEEKPKYTLVKKIGKNNDIEIRNYEASTAIEWPMKSENNTFMTL